MEKRRVSVLESYSLFKEKYNKEDKHFMTKKQFNKVVLKFGKKLTYYLITTGRRVILPGWLGSLQMVKIFIGDRKGIDYYNTNKIYGEHNKLNPDNKKIIYHRNKLTKGYIPKLYWSKKYARVKNRDLYSFEFTRPNRRPNSYNKKNPKISVIPFFKEKGYKIYDIYNPFGDYIHKKHQ